MRLNEDHVSAEEIDGELIAINFTTGKYFAMEGSAIEIWNALLSGHDGEAFIAGQTGRPGFDAGIAGEQVRAFIARLLAEDLLIDEAPSRAATPAAAGAGVWLTPELQEFEDMAAILKLDPVVDIAQAGWPQPA